MPALIEKQLEESVWPYQTTSSLLQLTKDTLISHTCRTTHKAVSVGWVLIRAYTLLKIVVNFYLFLDHFGLKIDQICHHLELLP